MDMHKWLSNLSRFLILLPGIASCYLPAGRHMKYPPAKTALFCLAVLIPYSLAASASATLLQINPDIILLPSLLPFFFLYRHTVDIDLPRSLAIYVGVWAIETFPAQFAYCFDAYLHPASGAADFSTEAALFQLTLSLVLLAAFIRPARRKFSIVIDDMDSPKIWYCSVAVSFIFLASNILMVPLSYSTPQAGRLFFLFPLLESAALIILIAIYMLFYRSSSLILEHAKLRERSHLLEMQSHQYLTLQEYIRRTAKLRHDLRHSLRLLASLAEIGDLDSIRSHLAEYELRLSENTPVAYCRNAALNALFGYYHEAALSAGIRTDWRIELPQPLTVSELDMASLFGNLMENAIAGCQTLKEDKRYFCLTAQIRHGNSLYVVSTNNFDGNVRKGKTGYRSTRHEGAGTGLASITAVAEKYGGTAHFYNSEKEFFADVVLKI